MFQDQRPNQAKEHLKCFNILRFGEKKGQQNSSLQVSDIWVFFFF